MTQKQNKKGSQPFKNLPKNKNYVLDASAVFNGILSTTIHGTKYLPECVLREIEGIFRGESLIAQAKQKKNVIILSPSKAAKKYVITQATKTGDIKELSDCDLEVLATAYELHQQGIATILLSDDYDIQNLASYLNIAYRGIYWKGIEWVYEYIWVCPACGAKSKEPQKDCPICGTALKRVIKKRKKAKKDER